MNKLILAITSCPVGVATTYVAAKQLTKAAKDLNYEIKVETQGLRGVENKLTNQEIEKAEAIIIASSIQVDLKRFSNKKIYEVDLNQVIKNPKEVILDALNKGFLYKTKLKSQNQEKTKNGLMKPLLNGVSYMVPFIILGGIFLALSLGLMKSINNEKQPVLNAMLKIGESSFTLMIPILAGYIAYSIAGKSALAPSMVVAFLANDKKFFYHYKFIENFQFQPLGFVGAILIGYLIGFSIKQLNKLKLPEPLLPIIPLFITPILIGGSFAIFVIFLLGPLLGILMHYLQEGLTQLYSNNFEVKIVTFFISLVIGAMAGFDMGGPVNKMAFLTCSLMIQQDIKQPMGAMAAAIPVAPLGMGLTTLIFKSKFDLESKNLGISSLVSGFIGISEGAIPFALKDPKKVIIANVVGSSIAAGIASLFSVTNNAAHGGPIMALVGAVPYGMQTIYFLIAILIGTIITSCLYGFMLSRSKKV